MAKYSVHQAKSQLSQLIQKALSGEEVVIANRDKPLVKLTLVEAPKRSLGFFQGKVEVAPDFDETPEDFEDYT